MRRLHGGCLAGLVLVMAGCGAGEDRDLTVPAAVRFETPTLAASSRDALPIAPPLTTSRTVLVTSPGGVGAAGLDAAVTILTGRPDMRTVVVAPATRNETPRRTEVVASLFGAVTMSGYPARAVNASAADAVAAGLGLPGGPPDLVIVGIDEGALGSARSDGAALAAARAATDAEVPALVVTVGGDRDPDMAAAAMSLASILDTDLDRLLEPGARVLTVPTCTQGTVRGPVSVEAAAWPSEDGGIAVEPDCTVARPGPFDDEIGAYAGGYATFVELGR